MYCETHGTGRWSLLSAIDATFGRMLPPLPDIRQAITAEQQGHTAGIDRPLSYE